MSEAPASCAPAKKKRSPVERLIVWGLIGVLLVVVLIEYRASRNFNAALQTMEVMDHPTLDELKAQISGETVSEKQTDKTGTVEVEFGFLSLFKGDKYKLRVQLADIPKNGDKDLIAKLSAGGGTVANFYQPETLAEEKNRKIEPSGEVSVLPHQVLLHHLPTPSRPLSLGRGMSAIAANPAVVSKLNITDEQAEKIKQVAEANQMDFGSFQGRERSEIMAAFAESRTKIANGIKEVLDDEQFDTIQRMTWAQQGPMALAQDAVAAKIGLTEDQVAELAKILEGMDFRNPPVDEMLAVLNDEQKTKWAELIEGMEPPAPPEGAQRPSRPTIEE